MRTITLHKDDVFNGYLVLVNRTNPIKGPLLKNISTLVPFSTVDEKILLERRASASLIQLIKKINSKEKIVPVSGYRSKEEQETLFQDSLLENGRDFTERYVAFPNCSEHQTGLAIDLAENQPVIDFIRPSFPYSGIFADFRELAADYGFIERYEKNKENLTGISHEPWHFRYVGFPHANRIQKLGFCLEEYIQFLRDFPLGGAPYTFIEKEIEFNVFYVRANEEWTTFEIPDDCLYQLSGNNVDGIIVTIWSTPL